MRDPDRIEPILHLLGEVWRKDPDLRLGQLLVIAIRPSEPVPQIFHAEDDVLVEGLQALEKKLAGGRGDGPGDTPSAPGVE